MPAATATPTTEAMRVAESTSWTFACDRVTTMSAGLATKKASRDSRCWALRYTTPRWASRAPTAMTTPIVVNLVMTPCTPDRLGVWPQDGREGLKNRCVLDGAGDVRRLA